MRDKWACWHQKVKGQCYSGQIETLEKEIEQMKDDLEILDRKNEFLKKSLHRSHLMEVLKVEGTYLDSYTLSPLDIQNHMSTPSTSCSMTPQKCAGLFWYKTKIKEGLRNKLCKAITHYNALMSVCWQLQYFYTQNSPQLAYAHYFLKTIEEPDRIVVLCSEMTNFLKALPEQTKGKLFLFSSETTTKVAPESYLVFDYQKGSLCICHLHVSPMHKNGEEVLLAGLEEFAQILSTYLSGKRYLPIGKLQGELGLERYSRRETLRKAYLRNNFQPQGKSYPDGTYLPYQIMTKTI